LGHPGGFRGHSFTSLGETRWQAEQLRDIKLYAWRFQFSPSTITVNFGDKVRIHLESTDVNHGLAIPAFGVHAVVLAGRPVIVEFIAYQEGTFPFYSAVFSGRHWDRMTGTLVVLPPGGR